MIDEVDFGEDMLDVVTTPIKEVTEPVVEELSAEDAENAQKARDAAKERAASRHVSRQRE